MGGLPKYDSQHLDGESSVGNSLAETRTRNFRDQIIEGGLVWAGFLSMTHNILRWRASAATNSIPRVFTVEGGGGVGTRLAKALGLFKTAPPRPLKSLHPPPPPPDVVLANGKRMSIHKPCQPFQYLALRRPGYHPGAVYIYIYIHMQLR